MMTQVNVMAAGSSLPGSLPPTPSSRPVRKARFINFDAFEKGQVYNRTYIGSNEEYKKQCGKTTILITEIHGGRVYCTELFAQHPDFGPEKQYRTNPYSFSLAVLNTNPDYEYELVFDESQYYKHVQGMTMREAVDSGLVTLDAVKRVFRDQSGSFIREEPVAYVQQYSSGQMVYPTTRRLVMPAEQGVSDNPLLQSICFEWKDTDEMKQDVRSVYPEAWFMD